MDATRRAMMNVSGLDLLGFAERIARWLIRAVVRPITAVTAWNRTQKKGRALLDMSDHMLKDIGISRVDAVHGGGKALQRR
jgi:uncharacterized protein YjiS (DUF1127 family)